MLSGIDLDLSPQELNAMSLFRCYKCSRRIPLSEIYDFNPTALDNAELGRAVLLCVQCGGPDFLIKTGKERFTFKSPGS